MNNNKEKPLLPFIKALSKDRLLHFNRLTVEDAPKVSTFLNSIWSQYYGKTGSPVFHPDYLQWIFGGPNKDKNLLFGASIDNNLVAYQSFLFRKISCCKKILNTYLHTHLAVSPKIDLRLKMDCGYQQGDQAILFHPDSSYYNPSCDAVYGFVEESKPLKSVGDKILAKYFQIERITCSTFNQFVVLPKRLTQYLIDNPLGNKSFSVRAATEQDSPQLTKLFNRVPDEPHFIMIMSEEELKYYFFGRSTSRVFLIEVDEEIRAFIFFYPVETIKDGKISLYIAVEFLAVGQVKSEASMYVASLLYEAVKCADSIGAKGIVLENATYLDYETYRPLGLAPTFRKMSMIVASKENSVNYVGGFRCDIK
jgi:hypothetical protein